MKKVVWTLAMLALTCGAASAQDVNEQTAQAMPERQMSTANTLDKALIANERKINDAVAKGDKAAFTALVAPNAWSADGNGFMKVSDFVPMLDQYKVTSWEIADEKVSWIDNNTAIVTYKWTGAGTFQGQPLPSPVYASSVWTKKGDKWLVAFHQESEASKK
ncbi:MAG TPA: nuclear transport factor 2 family protein [Vicinamibacterales bacterium]|nr:nuclear transport factor 2 family protein [Vicinamibacterales bacterium]